MQSVGACLGSGFEKGRTLKGRDGSVPQVDVSKHASAPFSFCQEHEKPDSEAFTFLFECIVPVFCVFFVFFLCLSFQSVVVLAKFQQIPSSVVIIKSNARWQWQGVKCIESYHLNIRNCKIIALEVNSETLWLRKKKSFC